MDRNLQVLEAEQLPQDVLALFSWANIENGSYKDFSASRAEARARAHQQLQEAAKTDCVSGMEEPETATEAIPAAQTFSASSAGKPAESAFGAHAFVPHAEPMPHLYPPPAASTLNWPTQYAPPANEPRKLPYQAHGAPSIARHPVSAGSRWSALNRAFTHAAKTSSEQQNQLPPTLAVFSLAGGVGKTSLLASLATALSAHGENVLLVDAAPYSALPLYFGTHSLRPGMLHSFHASRKSALPPIQMLSAGQEDQDASSWQEFHLAELIARHSAGAGRILIDLATASGASMRDALRMAPIVLIPVLPEINSIASIHSIESFFRNHAGAAESAISPYYLLNQFDAALPLHHDMRAALVARLSDRLLPFAIHRSIAVSEALAEGATVLDYAPASAHVADIAALAEWIRSMAAPVSADFSCSRWSER
jgi:cellulose synthase operon protein YhjQ